MHTLFKRGMQQNGGWPRKILSLRSWVPLLGLLLVHSITTTSAKKSDKKDGPTLKDFKYLVNSAKFKNAFATLLMDVLKDDGTKKKFVEMMKKIANDQDPDSIEDDIEIGSRWGWGEHASPRKDPKLDRWIKGFRKLVQDEKENYLKEAVRLSRFMLGDKEFRQTFGEFLESTNIKVKNQKKKGKGKKKKTKQLTKDSMDYSDE